MHMSDALLSPAVGAALWVGALTGIAYCSKKVKEDLDEKKIPLMGVVGAFIFAAQMVNFTIPGTGSSGHLGGGMILAALLGPCAAFLVMSSILAVQALFFADGGLFAFGSNVWNLAFYASFIAYPFIYRPITAKGTSRRRISVAAILGSVVALQLGALSVVAETLLSGRSELPVGPFLMFMQPIHLVIGIVEGLVTAGVINYVRSAKPEILQGVASSTRLLPEIKVRKVVLSFLAISLVVAGFVSWFASSNPDGLEWSIAGVYGDTDLPARKNTITSVLGAIRQRTAFLPDYAFWRNTDKAAQADDENRVLTGHAETSVSGVIGAIMTVVLIGLAGFGVRAFRGKRRVQPTGTGHSSG